MYGRCRTGTALSDPHSFAHLDAGAVFFGGLFACGVKKGSGGPDAELKSASGLENPEGYPDAKRPDMLLEKRFGRPDAELK